MSRTRSVTAISLTPASARRRFASTRAAATSREKPGRLTSSASDRARFAPGRISPPTYVTKVDACSPAPAGPALSFFVLDEHKGAAAEDMGLWELWVLGELGRAIDAVPGRGKIRQHRGVRPLQVKNNR